MALTQPNTTAPQLDVLTPSHVYSAPSLSWLPHLWLASYLTVAIFSSYAFPAKDSTGIFDLVFSAPASSGVSCKHGLFTLEIKGLTESSGWAGSFPPWTGVILAAWASEGPACAVFLSAQACCLSFLSFFTSRKPFFGPFSSRLPKKSGFLPLLGF